MTQQQRPDAPSRRPRRVELRPAEVAWLETTITGDLPETYLAAVARLDQREAREAAIAPAARADTFTLGLMARARVVAYCTEEVERQGHDLLRADGIDRVGWLLNAWSHAIQQQAITGRPTIADARGLGMLVERVRNVEGFRTCGVRVGSRLCPPPERVESLLTALWAERDVLAPLAFYKEFQLVHPFRDGNGRVGKILLAWLSDTLLNPVFPPADLFGEAIRNP
jgi:hypothetical protein